MKVSVFVCKSLHGNSGGLTSRGSWHWVSGTEGWVPLSPGPQAGACWQRERLNVRVLAPVLGLVRALGLGHGHGNRKINEPVYFTRAYFFYKRKKLPGCAAS